MRSAAKLAQTTETYEYDTDEIRPVARSQANTEEALIPIQAPERWIVKTFARSMWVSGAVVMITAAQCRLALLAMDYANHRVNVGAVDPAEAVYSLTVKIALAGYLVALVGCALETKPTWRTPAKVGSFAVMQLAATLSMVLAAAALAFYSWFVSAITDAGRNEAAAEIIFAMTLMGICGILFCNYKVSTGWVEHFSEVEATEIPQYRHNLRQRYRIMSAGRQIIRAQY